jgi:hypothetical protein
MTAWFETWNDAALPTRNASFFAVARVLAVRPVDWDQTYFRRYRRLLDFYVWNVNPVVWLHYSAVLPPYFPFGVDPQPLNVEP